MRCLLAWLAIETDILSSGIIDNRMSPGDTKLMVRIVGLLDLGVDGGEKEILLGKIN